MVKSMLLDSAKKAGLIVCALTFILAAPLAPAQDIVGEWDVEIDFQGNLVQAKIVFEMKDGALAGKFISQQGENDLTEVKFEDGKLTFMRHVEFGGQAFDLAFQGTIEGDELKGNFVSDFGEIPITGKRGGATSDGGSTADVKPGLPGVWNLMVDSQLGNNERTLTVNDDLTGTYGFEGENYALKDTKVDGDKVTFNVTIDVQGQELAMAFEGTMDGATLKGELSFEGGAASVEGTKAGGGPAAEEAIAGPVNLPGTWELTGDPGDGSGAQVMRLIVKEVDGNFTAIMQSDAGDLTIEKIVVEGNDISFTTEFSIDPSIPGIPVEFKGKVGSGRVKGTLTVKIEGFEQAIPLEGKKINDETEVPSTSP